WPTPRSACCSSAWRWLMRSPSRFAGAVASAPARAARPPPRDRRRLAELQAALAARPIDERPRGATGRARRLVAGGVGRRGHDAAVLVEKPLALRELHPAALHEIGDARRVVGPHQQLHLGRAAAPALATALAAIEHRGDVGLQART